MIKKVPNLPPDQVYPDAVATMNLNCCGDPDCGNYGEPPDYTVATFKGPGAAVRKKAAARYSNSIALGLGQYVQGTAQKGENRVSSIVEYYNDPHSWPEDRILICKHERTEGTCDIQFKVLSNLHFAEEQNRLRDHNEVLGGPRCGACGTKYLQAPQEFIFNGVNARKSARVRSVRVIHKPCQGKPGARFTVSREDARQQEKDDNARILAELVNEVGINALRRLLSADPNAEGAGVSRIYNRILWLERVLLAYERAQLKAWRDRYKESGTRRHTRIAHDDIGPVAVWCRSFDHVMCSKGDEPWAQAERMNFARTRCGSR